MPRILVVDDDPLVARTLVDLLALHDHVAVRADSAASRPCEHAGRGPFDLVMLDLRMPGIDGFETCIRIRERFGASLPVLMLTGAPDPAVAAPGLRGGRRRLPAEAGRHTGAHPEGARVPAPQGAARRDGAAPRAGAGARARPGAAARDRPRLVADRRAGGVQPHGHAAAGGADRRAHLPDRARTTAQTRELRVALPAHGLSDEAARAHPLPGEARPPAAAGPPLRPPVRQRTARERPAPAARRRRPAARRSRWCWCP